MKTVILLRVTTVSRVWHAPSIPPRRQTWKIKKKTFFPCPNRYLFTAEFEKKQPSFTRTDTGSGYSTSTLSVGNRPRHIFERWGWGKWIRLHITRFRSARDGIIRHKKTKPRPIRIYFSAPSPSVYKILFFILKQSSFSRTTRNSALHTVGTTHTVLNL